MNSFAKNCARFIGIVLLLLLPLISIAVDRAQRTEQGQAKYITAGHAKIAVIGAGLVGSTVAYALMLKNVASEIILVDVDEKRCQGEVLDLSDALSFCYASKVRKGNLKDASKADIIVITAGSRRKPGQSRLDLIKVNKSIITSIIRGMMPLNPYAIILMVSNPVDIMTFLAQQISDLPKNQVFGSGTFLDTQRLCGFLAEKIGVSQQSIQAYILGEHGDSQFPAWSSAQIAGIPIIDFPGITTESLVQYARETKEKAYEIFDLKGATYYGIGACVAEICENIIFNQKRIMPVSCFIKELGVCLSMPAIVGEDGVEQILPIPLNEEEKESLNKSAHVLYTVIEQLE